MTAGLLLAAVPMLTNNATRALHLLSAAEGQPLFYIGAGIMVAVQSGWSAGQVILTWWQWKRAHPGQMTPLVTYMCVATWMMWMVASLGLVVEVVVLLIPWSLGLTAGVDPLLTKTLFWWTGHPIVYFWLLPAYICWYAFVPSRPGAAGLRTADPAGLRLVFAEQHACGPAPPVHRPQHLSSLEDAAHVPDLPGGHSQPAHRLQSWRPAWKTRRGPEEAGAAWLDGDICPGRTPVSRPRCWP